MKITIIISALALMIGASSCGNDSGEKGSGKDTTSVKTPAQLSALNKQIEENPEDPELYHKRARYYYENHKYEAGIADMTRVLSIDSSKAEYFVTLSDLYFVSNQTSKSKTYLEKSIQLDPKNTEAMLKLGELYLYIKEYDKSISYINMALKVDEFNSKAYFMKGMCYKQLKDTTRAISSMQTAVEQNQKYYQAYIQLGILNAARKNPLAAQYYKNAISLEPKSTEAWYNLGKYYQDIKDYSNALLTYDQLLTFDPANKYVHYNMGVINLVGLKDRKTAMGHFSRAIELDATYAQAYYSMGVCYQEEGNKKLATKYYTDCLRVDPHYEPAKEALQLLK
jgi:tetratricopeptide (TPR) repeat protein